MSKMTRERAMEIIHAEAFHNSKPYYTSAELLEAFHYVEEQLDLADTLSSIQESYGLTLPQVREGALLYCQYGKESFKEMQKRLEILDYIAANSKWKPKKDCVSIFGGVVNFSLRIDVDHYSDLDKIFHFTKESNK